MAVKRPDSSDVAEGAAVAVSLLAVSIAMQPGVDGPRLIADFRRLVRGAWLGAENPGRALVMRKLDGSLSAALEELGFEEPDGH